MSPRAWAAMVVAMAGAVSATAACGRDAKREVAPERVVTAPPPLANDAGPAARADQAAASAPVAKQTHKVTKGETLITIARKHGCNSVKDFASMNGLAAPRYSLREGQTLRVPTCGA
mgnify:CR=1 FL=1